MLLQSDGSIARQPSGLVEQQKICAPRIEVRQLAVSLVAFVCLLLLRLSILGVFVPSSCCVSLSGAALQKVHMCFFCVCWWSADI
jgi:hypothetical protein